MAFGAKSASKIKKRNWAGKRFVEMSLLQSAQTFQSTTSLELSLSFAKKFKKTYYMPYLGIYAVNLENAYDDTLSQYGTSGLGLRLGAGIPRKIYGQLMSFMAYVGYAEIITQKDQWWGVPENNIKEDSLFTVSFGIRFYFKKFSIIYRSDINSLKTYQRSQNIGIGYFF